MVGRGCFRVGAGRFRVRGVRAPASIRDTVRAPYNTTSGPDCVKSLRLSLHGTCPQRESGDTTPCRITGVSLHSPCRMTGVTLHIERFERGGSQWQRGLRQPPRAPSPPPSSPPSPRSAACGAGRQQVTSPSQRETTGYETDNGLRALRGAPCRCAVQSEAVPRRARV